MLDTEGHRGLLDGCIDGLEKPCQFRIGDLVEHHEAGVDGDFPACFIDAQGMAVASHVVVRIQEGDFMAGMQEPGTCQACNARANDGHACYDAPPLSGVVATSGQPPS